MGDSDIICLMKIESRETEHLKAVFLVISVGKESFALGLIYFCRAYILHAFLSTDILQGNFKPDFYLKYIQKDLRLAIALGDSVNHPTPMAAAANEVRVVQMCVTQCFFNR